MKIQKTNAARLLDKAGIAYTLISYAINESDLSAMHLAKQLNIDIAQVFKTLVLQGDKTGTFVCVVAGNHELDLKKTALLSGNKNCSLIPLLNLLGLTGYMRGGCSPIGMKKTFPTYVDKAINNFENIYINAGQRGMQFLLTPKDLLFVTQGILCDMGEKN